MKFLEVEEIVDLCQQAITREKWFDDGECTKKLDEVFSQRARQMNVVAQYKNHPKEFLGLDMVWWDGERLIAAIEYENVPGTANK